MNDTKSVCVSYRIIDTPIGPLLLAMTDKGLVRVAFENEDFAQVINELAQQLNMSVLEEADQLDAVANEFAEYFSGKRQEFDVPVDHSLSTGFRQTVQQYLPQISYGQTQSYQEVAESVGSPKAVRAVGTACATNPIPVVVPCHRVLRTDGSLGGYRGGLEVKTALLQLEQAA